MPSFTYGCYVHFNYIDETPKSYHKFSIGKKEPDMTIMTPSIILTESLILLPKMVVEKMPVLWIQENVHIVVQISTIDVWNQKSQKKEEMFTARDEFKKFWVVAIIQDFVMALLNFLN